MVGSLIILKLNVINIFYGIMVHGKNTPKRRNESGKFEKENTFDSDDEENERL